MSSIEFETVSSDDDDIVVRHITTGHVFTYNVATNPSGERLLQLNGMQDGARPGEEDWQRIASRAQTYAQLEMERTGRVDPKILTGGRIRR